MLGLKNVSQWALGARTSTFFAENREQIARENADLYVLGIGCNDIRYRDSSVCAMDAKQFIANIDLLVKALLHTHTAQIVVISPWLSFEPDRFCHTSVAEKLKLYGEYAAALEQYCIEGGHLYINPNPYIQQAIHDDHMYRAKYLRDHIHPNADQGIQLFSKACVVASMH